jgi:hypothetical protein
MKTSKDRSLLLWTLLLAAVLLVIACGGTKPALSVKEQVLEMGPPAIETVTLEKRVYLSEQSGGGTRSDASGSPSLNISLSLLDITGFTALQNNFQDIFYKGLSTADYITEFTNTISKEYKAQKNKEDQKSLDWFYHETIALRTRTATTLVVSLDREYYTGGAHGMTERNYYLFDLDNGNRLFLADILEEDALPALKKLAEGELRSAMNIPARVPLTEKDFFSDTLDILYDFYISSKGIGIQWDPYEIAPYSTGAMEILIPTQLIEGLLNPKGLSVLKDLS